MIVEMSVQFKPVFGNVDAKNKLLRSVAGCGIETVGELHAKWDKMELMIDSHQLMVKEQVGQCCLAEDFLSLLEDVYLFFCAIVSFIFLYYSLLLSISVWICDRLLAGNCQPMTLDVNGFASFGVCGLLIFSAVPSHCQLPTFMLPGGDNED